jgi:hypothetical protein
VSFFPLCFFFWPAPARVRCRNYAQLGARRTHVAARHSNPRTLRARCKTESHRRTTEALNLVTRLSSPGLAGEQRGKYNRPDPSLTNRFVMGSIRNPWDWYVSLWAYGCLCKGSVYLQTNRPFSLRYCIEQLGSETGCRAMPRPIFRQYKGELGKPQDEWAACYKDRNDASRFRD